MILVRDFNIWKNKSLESTKSKTNENKNGENVYHLEITEVVLVHCNIVNSDYQHGLCMPLFLRCFN